MLKELYNRITHPFSQESVAGDLKSTDWAAFYRALYSMTFTPGQPQYTEITTAKAVREGYKMAVPVYRAIRAIIQAGSGIPWVVLDKDGEQIDNHPFATAWANPNPEFSGQDNMEYLIAHLVLGGNAYLRPIYIGGLPREFWVEMPDLVAPIPSGNREDWIEGYEYTLSDGIKVKVSKETFIHFKQVDPGNLYLGMGAILPAGRVIDTYNEALNTQKVSMQNRGIPSGHLFPEEPMDPEQFTQFKEKFRDQYLSKATRREPWLYPQKMQWIEANQTAVEMDFTNSQWANIRQIAAAIGVDPWWLGDREHSTYNNVSEARRALYEDVVIPILDDIEATLNLKIAPLYRDGSHITYDISNVAVLQDSLGDQIDRAAKLFSLGVPFSQINSKLNLGFGEFPGWDQSWMPYNLMAVGESGQLQTPDREEESGQKSIDLETEEQKAVYWKQIDTHRAAYWPLVAKKIKPLYEAEGVAVQNAIKGVSAGKLEAAVKRAILSKRAEWEEIITALDTTIAEDFGESTARNLGAEKGFKWNFDPFTAATRSWLSSHVAEGVTSILDTNIKEAGNIITAGVAENLPIDDIGAQLSRFYTERADFNAMRVARTEVSAAAGFGQREAAKQSGVVTKKRWLSSRDDRVRDSHAGMDGQTRGIDERYSNGLMYPGDTGGRPEEFVMCRCTELYITGR